MNISDPISQLAIPWYQSKIIRRLALSIVVQLLAVLHLSKYVAGVDLSILVDDILEAAGILYAAWAVHARVTKPVPPIVGTQNASAATPFLTPQSTPQSPSEHK